jgi:nucleotide-binding universal stress UspA family protein
VADEKDLSSDTDYVQLMEDSAQSALNNEAARLQGKGVEVTTVLRMGSPWEQVLDVAGKLEVGLIVMGTHGRRGLPRALLGSVAEKVVRLSPVPVLTVH